MSSYTPDEMSVIKNKNSITEIIEAENVCEVNKLIGEYFENDGGSLKPLLR